MKNNRIYASLIAILTLVLLLGGMNVVADPVIESVVTEPESPEPLSTFTVLATITGYNIISVNVTISECTDGPPEQCFVPHLNLPMTLNTDGKYETDLTLTGTQESIDHVQYQFVINDDGVEYTPTDDLKTYLDISDDNGGSTTNGDLNDDNGTPGFELLTILIALFLGLLIYKKKR